MAGGRVPKAEREPPLAQGTCKNDVSRRIGRARIGNTAAKNPFLSILAT